MKYATKKVTKITEHLLDAAVIGITDMGNMDREKLLVVIKKVLRRCAAHNTRTVCAHLVFLNRRAGTRVLSTASQIPRQSFVVTYAPRGFQPAAYDAASARETSIAATGTIMGGLDLVVGLLENGDLMGKVAETARLYWTNSALTVNVFRYHQF